MGTVWETLAVYGLQAALWFAALYRRGTPPCVVALAFALPISWLWGEVFIGNDRDVAMMATDLAMMALLMHFHHDAHQRLVAALALICIGIRAAYVTDHYTSHYAYAVALNCAVVLQLLIAGGWIDQWGKRLDHWLDRVHPRIANAVRNVAT